MPHARLNGREQRDARQHAREAKGSIGGLLLVPDAKVDAIGLNLGTVRPAAGFHLLYRGQ